MFLCEIKKIDNQGLLIPKPLIMLKEALQNHLQKLDQETPDVIIGEVLPESPGSLYFE